MNVRIRRDQAGYQVSVNDERAGPWYRKLDDALDYVRDVFNGTDFSGDNSRAATTDRGDTR